MAKFYCKFLGGGVTQESCLDRCKQEDYQGNPPCQDFPKDIVSRLGIKDDNTKEHCAFLWRVLREKVGNTDIVVSWDNREDIYDKLKDYEYCFQRAPGSKKFVNAVIKAGLTLVGPDEKARELRAKRHTRNLQKMVDFN